MKMLGLDFVGFPQQNTVELSEETLIQKFTSLPPQGQLTFVNSIQNPENHFQVLNYPLQTESFQKPIQLIMSMFSQIMDLSYDKGISESFMGFLIALSKSTKFNYPKFIT